MITFDYVLGGNLVLKVSADILLPEPEVNSAGGVDIVNIRLPDGQEFEVDDIRVVGWGSSQPLLELLEEAAMEASNELL
jgi:hypothetical protein